jgi:hypothetical protein
VARLDCLLHRFIRGTLRDVALDADRSARQRRVTRNIFFEAIGIVKRERNKLASTRVGKNRLRQLRAVQSLQFKS